MPGDGAKTDGGGGFVPEIAILLMIIGSAALAVLAILRPRTPRSDRRKQAWW